MEKVFICVDDNALFQPVCDYGIYVAKTIEAEPVFIHVIESPELGENFYGLAAGGIVLGEKDMVMSQYGAFDEEKSKLDAQLILSKSTPLELPPLRDKSEWNSTVYPSLSPAMGLVM